MLRLSLNEVTYAQTTEELNPICQDFYDFVVVDVGPEHIVDALREIRATEQLQNTSVLVRVERLMEEYAMLAKYRAFSPYKFIARKSACILMHSQPRQFAALLS